MEGYGTGGDKTRREDMATVWSGGSKGSKELEVCIPETGIVGL